MKAFIRICAFATAVVGASASVAQQDAAEEVGVALAPEPGLAKPPQNWAYLPELAIFGPAEIYKLDFAAPQESGPIVRMDVHTKKNVGILTREVSVPLTDATRLAWKWKVDLLPSALSELVAQQHDYLSIAVKFDNGKDLTYMWSATLPEETGFECPLPGWENREWHVVVRSDKADLGKWLSEQRNVLADYEKVIGGKAPGKIDQVWLISNSIIQQTEGRASYGDIILTGANGEPVRVL